MKRLPAKGPGYHPPPFGASGALMARSAGGARRSPLLTRTERRPQRDARALRASRPAAPAVLRRPARAHRLLARREHAGHAQHARATPTASRAASRSASSPTRERRAAAHRPPRPPARLRRRHRSRRAVRRGARSATTPGAPGYDSWVCRLYRGWPRAAFFVMNASYSCGAADALRLLRRGRRATASRRRGTVWQEIARRRRGRLRPQRRLPLHELRRLRVDRRRRTAARTCTAT